jgi:hypothetical protein
MGFPVTGRLDLCGITSSKNKDTGRLMIKLVGQIKSLPVKAENDSFIFDIVEYRYDNKISLSPSRDYRNAQILSVYIV